MVRNATVVLALSLLLAGELAPAEESAPAASPLAVTYHQENDGPWLNPFSGTDRYYTHGVALSVVHHPGWADSLASALPFGLPAGRAGVAYSLTHQMYTPEDLTTSSPLPADRPYAGRAYLAFALQRADSRVSQTAELAVGAVGPVTMAGEIQKRAHDAWGGREPEGWGQQVANHPLFQLSVDRRRRFSWGESVSVDILPAAGGSIGSVLFEAFLAGELRFGFNLPRAFGRTAEITPRLPISEPRPGIGVFGELGGAGRGVIWNRLITGGGGGGEITPEPLVGELGYGGGVTLRLASLALEASYRQVLESRRFDLQRGTHRYGSATFSLLLYP
ncbi:MAG: lipid A deacylase LpxR family protein [Spirochaetaceae bacterium]